MEPLVLTMGWLGIFAPLTLGAIGSMIGVGRGGQAAAGAMLEVEGGYGRFVGVAAMPSSQTIYGIVVMLTLNRSVTLGSSPGLFVLGTFDWRGAARQRDGARKRLCCRHQHFEVEA